jgi:heat-inducible transcriptional repressor
VEPKVNMMLFKEIEFVSLSRNTILIVFVTSSGVVHTRIANTEEELGQDVLNSMKSYMNERCQNVPFYELKNRIFEDMRKDRDNFDRLMVKVLYALETITDKGDDREIHIDGTSKIIGVPEFSDINRLRELFQAFEKKERLLRLLDRSLNEEGAHVIIGAESDVREMRDMSIITSTYRIGADNYGILGVIGPVRMDYSKLIPIVNYTAKTVTELLSIM